MKPVFIGGKFKDITPKANIYFEQLSKARETSRERNDYFLTRGYQDNRSTAPTIELAQVGLPR